MNLMSNISFAVDSSADSVSHAGEGVSFGTFGEILQGALAPNGEEFLVTLPIELYSHVHYSRSSGTTDLTVDAPNKRKSLKLAKAMLSHLGEPHVGHLHIRSSLPEGKGLASSSADLVATARAIVRAYGAKVTCAELEGLLREVEPTDGVMYPGCVWFDHRAVRLREHLGFLPAMEIVACDEGGVVDTVDYNRIRKSFTAAEMDEFGALLSRLTAAVAGGDLPEIGRVATRSAQINQSRNPKRHLATFLDLANETAALGVVTSHSGTYLGLLYASDDHQASAKMYHVLCALERLGIRAERFSSWRGALPAPRSALNWSSASI